MAKLVPTIRLASLVVISAVVAGLVVDVQQPTSGPVAASAFTSAPSEETSAATRAAITSSTTTVATRAAVAAPAVASLPRTATPSADLPMAALNAYERAEQVIDSARPGCHLTWGVLAAIGQVESDHDRAGTTGPGAGPGIDGTSATPVRGTVLDGTHGSARVVDTDGGRLDGITGWDRAVGPMQFLPATWITVRVDGDGDGVRSPDDLDDASLAAAVFLCAWDEDLSTPTGATKAIAHYNHTPGYATTVEALARTYDSASYLTYGWTDVLSATWSGPTLLASAPPATTTSLDPTNRPTIPQTDGNAPHAAMQPTSSSPVGPTPSPTDASSSATPSAPATDTPAPGPSAPASDDAADAPGTPATTETPSPTPTPSPSPTEATSGPTTVRGTLDACGDQGFCLDGQALDLGALDTPAAADLDHDHTIESRRAELTGLAGNHVVVTFHGDDPSGPVTEVNGTAW